MRNEGIGRQTEVTLGFKESKVFLANVVKGCPLHDCIYPFEK